MKPKIDKMEIKEDVLFGRVCGYCNVKTVKAKGKQIYGPGKFEDLNIFLCMTCKSYVGTHQSSGLALGRVANATLRKKKSETHLAFDPIHKKGYLSRREAYIWLSEQLDISRQYVHIAMFDEETCEKVIELSNNYLNNNG